MGGHTFPKDINLKVNVLLRQEFELAYDDVTVKHVSHYATETSDWIYWLITNVTLFIESNDKHDK